MISRATKAIKWRFAGGPMMARFCGIWILSPLIDYNNIEIKKSLSESKVTGPLLLREREREHMVPVKLNFSHNFDFLCCTNSWACVRYCYVTWNKLQQCLHTQWAYSKLRKKAKLGPSINGLVTDGNTKLRCRGFILALFQSITANKIDSKHTRDYKRLLLVCEAEILRVTVK